jgi:drug/metabolite transporter (DMT)-like permease
MDISPWYWVIFTVIAAGSQTLRNAMQKELTATLGTVGATHVRFLFGLPFAIVFLALIIGFSGGPFIPPSGGAILWTLFGGLAQIGATALMLAAMQLRSFVVATALTKIEPVWVALFGLVFLGDLLSTGTVIAILVATSGVMVMSWPKQAVAGAEGWSWRPAGLGVISGAMFGLAAIGYRGGIRMLDHPNFVVGAATILVTGLLIQVIVLTTYLLLRDRENLMAILRAWRPSMFAGFMGAFASQFWFLAFAIESAARVRTLALVEILFAQVISRNLFKQSLASRDALGIVLIVIGVILLLNL